MVGRQSTRRASATAWIGHDLHCHSWQRCQTWQYDARVVASDFVLVVVQAAGGQPLRVPLVKRITTVGSDPTADVRLVIAPTQWAVITRSEHGVDVHIAATGERKTLGPGERMSADGIELAIVATAVLRERERSIEELVSALAAVDSPERAIELMLKGLIAASGADVGAVILADPDGYSVAAARDASGAVLEGARDLLSDTIVRDVLGTGERVQIDDVKLNSRYAQIPSVAALSLGSALCLPLRLDGRALGAVFLARHQRVVLDDLAVTELRILAALAVPFLAQLRRLGTATAQRDELIGDSQPVRELRGLIRRIGPTDLSALLHGPSGSGKELVARAIHGASGRAARPMIAINCASIAPTLLDAELFGYRKGAFTGALADRVGLIEAAHGSTLFLDEIGDMPLAMQAALLRVLEQREVKRLGDTAPRAVDFRLLCATHKDLEREAAEGRFRADLLFRLREVTLEVPPLAARGDDIALLAHAFLRQTEAQLGLPGHVLTEDAVAALRGHPWPGNVRELKATMRRIAVLADSKLIRAADLGFASKASLPSAVVTPTAAVRASDADAIRALVDAAIANGAPLQPLGLLRDAFVRSYVELAIARNGGDRDAAAAALEIGVRTLYRYLAP
jgi:transcriptional regulator with GAF, ATPase, and Fis domain